MSGVLGNNQIRERKDDIFASNWSEDCLQEASYELRVANDVLMVEGKLYKSGDYYKNPYFVINPGDLALLSSIETFHLPGDIVGRLGIKFRYTRQGLTPLFGAQVDPYYGSNISYEDHPGERIYLWVSNLGPSPIDICPRDRVFTIEFHTVSGSAEHRQQDRGRIREQIEREAYKIQASARMGFMDVIRQEAIEEATKPFREEINHLTVRVDAMEKGTSQVVLFGVFLVASAIIATALAAIFGMLFAIDLAGESYLAGSFTKGVIMTLFYVATPVLVAAILILTLAGIARPAITLVSSLGKPSKPKTNGEK